MSDNSYITIRVTPLERMILEALAAQNDRSRSYEARRAIRELGTRECPADALLAFHSAGASA